MVFLAGDVTGFPVRIQGQLHLLDALTLGFKLCPLGLQMVDVYKRQTSPMLCPS